MIDIDYVMGLLDCNGSKETQELGLSLAYKVNCINVFIKPKFPYGERIWENCAKVLSQRADEELKPYIGELLTWLKDLNQPGTSCILERLKSSRKDKEFKILLGQCLNEAKKQNNVVWEKNLMEINNTIHENNISPTIIMELLDCNGSMKTQELGINLAKDIENLKIFINPPKSYDIWENCAKILSLRFDTELINYLFELYEWLKDPKCPTLIFDRLKKMKKSKRTDTVLELCIKKATNMGDKDWINKLCEIREIIKEDIAPEKYYSNIDYIMSLLKWDCTLEEQELGLNLARKVKCINAFILPMEQNFNKNVWENCARVLAHKSDNELAPYLTSILVWIQDLNWPGVFIILNRMRSYTKNELFYNSLNYCLKEAKSTNDKMWEISLNEIIHPNLY